MRKIKLESKHAGKYFFLNSVAGDLDLAPSMMKLKCKQ